MMTRAEVVRLMRESASWLHDVTKRAGANDCCVRYNLDGDATKLEAAAK